jgi:beta-lactamase class A
MPTIVSALLAALLALPQTPASSAPHSRIATTRQAIERLIALSGAEVSVAYRPLNASAGGDILIGPDVTYHAASTMKVPVMIELFRQVDTRALSLDDTVVVSNVFHSIVDGSEFTLPTSEEADGAAHRALGTPMTLRALCEEMITISSNLATNVLMEKLGVERIRATVTRLKAPGMNVLRGVEDQKAFDKGMSNETTARALLTLLTAIGNGTAASPTSCKEMIAILARQKFNDGIPAGLPAGTVVAHKTGTITRVHHDAGIVYVKQPYVLVVMTRGMADEKKSDLLIAEIARLINSINELAN